MRSAYATSEPAAEPRPGPTPMPLRLRECDEVPDDQEVVGEAHLADGLQLELRAGRAARRRSCRSARRSPASHSRVQVRERVLAAAARRSAAAGSLPSSSSTLQRSAISSVGRISSRPYGAKSRPISSGVLK